MKSKIYQFIFVFVFFTVSCFQTQADNIKTVIVTGQNNHNWPVSHVVLKQILENSGLFSVDLAISPKQGADMSNFILDFKQYQLVVVDYNGDAWPEKTKKSFLEFAKNGGGIVFYHAANNAFPEWKEFNEIIALGGWGGRNEKSGPYVYWENGGLVKNTEKGPGGSHGAQHEYVLNKRNTTNPILEGLPDQWKHAQDELYDKLRGPGNIQDVLYTAYANKEKGGSGREEPLLFTVNYGKARIFQTALGHAGPTVENNPAMQCTGFQVTLLRGCEWAATGKVTQKVPDDFPTAYRATLRKDYKYKEYPKPGDMKPDMTEFWTPRPPIVTPGSETKNGYLTAPSDAIVLFDGKDLSKWQKPNGEAAGWSVQDGVITVVASAGDIRTKSEFKDFQLHIEWSSPTAVSGSSQGRGNSGVYLQGLYEVQVLDTYENETYANGSAGSIYKQSPPLVNPIRKPGEWNAYDIIFTAPTFTKDGTYRTPPTVTVLFNGVIVQNHVNIRGTTEYIGHPRVVNRDKGPIQLQTHGNAVRYRNIWIREL
ncbi:hypothetical protein FACS1894123_02120 [Bacteroidia bacterium]|nr:hypothetical protein FACS1894123_02120 [Bacteroidia bacterium]